MLKILAGRSQEDAVYLITSQSPNAMTGAIIGEMPGIFGIHVSTVAGKPLPETVGLPELRLVNLADLQSQIDQLRALWIVMSPEYQGMIQGIALRLESALREFSFDSLDSRHYRMEPMMTRDPAHIYELRPLAQLLGSFYIQWGKQIFVAPRNSQVHAQDVIAIDASLSNSDQGFAEVFCEQWETTEHWRVGETEETVHGLRLKQ